MGCTRLILSVSACTAAAAFQFGVGTNLGNTLEAPCEGCYAPKAQRYFFSDYKAAGFQTIRIPVNWGNYMPMEAPYTINGTWLDRVQTVVGWCLDEGLNCIVNSHHDNWLNNQTEFWKMLPRYQSLWQQVGSAFASAPSTLLFESYNEPTELTTVQLNAMLQTFYNTTRASNPTRWLVFGWLQHMNPGWVSKYTSPGQPNSSNYDAMWLPSWQQDGRIAVEVHSYDPFPVCGNGIGPWGNEKDLAALQQTFIDMAAWSSVHGVPVFFGEFGCTNYLDSATRYKWYNAFASGCRSLTSGCLVWDDDAHFGVYNRTARTWNNHILQALGLGAT